MTIIDGLLRELLEKSLISMKYGLLRICPFEEIHGHC